MTTRQGPKISIITACYNSEKTIEQTIQSVLNQTYEHIEYIIIDGASTDRTMEIVDKYRERIDVIVSEKDNGVYDAFNKGVDYAKGEYILFLNSDDYFYEENVLKQFAELIIEKSNPIGVYGDIFKINEQTGFVDRYSRMIDLEQIKDGKMPPHPATLLKKDVIIEFGGFDLQYRIAADFDLLVKVFMKYEKDIFYTPIVTSVFRLGGLSSNEKTLPITKMETKKIINKHFSNYGSKYSEKIDYTNEFYLKKWLENIVFQKRSVSNALKKRNVKSVAIFGSGEMALLITKDFRENGIQVIGYLDNNRGRQGIIMDNVKVYHPEWIIEKSGLIDAIIFGFQGFHERDVTEQLNEMLIGKKNLLYISWRELVAEL